MTSLASFSAPYLFGGGFRVMTTQIVATRLNGDDRLAMVETAALRLFVPPGLVRLRNTEGRAVVAIALATTFSVHAPLVGRFVLVGTLWILPLAYLVRNLPVAGRDGSRFPCCAPRSPRAPVSPS